MADLRIDTERVRAVGTGLTRIAREFEQANVRSDQIADATGHAERDVDRARYPFDPFAIHAAALRAGGDVVEHQFVGLLGLVRLGQEQGVAGVAVVLEEAHVLHDASILYVQTGDDALG